MVYTSEYINDRYFTPPHAVEIPDDMPLVFLAGPVQGAPNYQDKFAQQLLEIRDNIAVASPRRTAENQAKFDPIEQVRWELASRRRAYMLGVTGIWYAAQDLGDTEYPAGREYAKTTAKEHFETIGRAEENPNVRYVVGIDPAYEPNMSGYNRQVLVEYGVDIVDNEDEFIARLLADARDTYDDRFMPDQVRTVEAYKEAAYNGLKDGLRIRTFIQSLTYERRSTGGVGMSVPTEVYRRNNKQGYDFQGSVCLSGGSNEFLADRLVRTPEGRYLFVDTKSGFALAADTTLLRDLSNSIGIIDTNNDPKASTLGGSSLERHAHTVQALKGVRGGDRVVIDY